MTKFKSKNKSLKKREVSKDFKNKSYEKFKSPNKDKNKGAFKSKNKHDKMKFNQKNKNEQKQPSSKFKGKGKSKKVAEGNSDSEFEEVQDSTQITKQVSSHKNLIIQKHNTQNEYCISSKYLITQK